MERISGLPRNEVPEYREEVKAGCPLNFRTTAATVIKVLSRCSKVAMRFEIRPLTTPSGCKLRNQHSYLENGRDANPAVCRQMVPQAVS
ncbi:hypothetical protein AVEN_136104-1 [Araneus ventricosus]|uniref:Uncharacterized protein n=2 Tax=Araneus ventricosus TaxID=182803 RepID=A0A4Y2PF68_ARAVE|nr:hypothetical protein AVEN_136104-1 [Araneus ventricosus]